MRTEGESELTQLQSKERVEPPDPGRDKRGFSLGDFGGNSPVDFQSDFGLLASRNVRE